MSDSSRASSFAEPTHTPQGDVKLFRFSPLKNQLTPRKGTITHRCFCTKCPHRNQLTPREGTITFLSKHLGIGLFESTYTPQGDVNGCISMSPLLRTEPTHTPQGDGSLVTNVLLNITSRFNSHPARGRKRIIESTVYELS